MLGSYDKARRYYTKTLQLGSDEDAEANLALISLLEEKRAALGIAHPKSQDSSGSKSENQDKKNYILERGKFSLVILNIYPYNNGHLMIAPIAHQAELEDLTAEESCEIMEKIRKWVKVLKNCFGAEGFNIGLNLGKVAGAGLENHLHFHIVPRWNGDTNFMPVLSGTKVLPDSLDRCYNVLKEAAGL